MSATNFPTVVDRSVETPSRIKLTPVSGDTYDMEMVSGSVEAQGTVINKQLFDNIRDNTVWNIDGGGTGATSAAQARTNLGVPATNDLAEVAFSGDYDDLENKPDIPSLTNYATKAWVEAKNYATQSWVTAKDYATKAWINAKNFYIKPNGGIPKSDLESIVQTSLNRANTALQDAPSNNKVYGRKNGEWSEVTGGGGGTTDHAQLSHLDYASSGHVGFASSAELSAKYTKPANGIPKTDLASGVQSSLNKADSALQSVPSTYRTASAQDAIDANKASVASLTAEQNARIAADADLSDDISTLTDAVAAKYTKPTAGIPKSDLASAVQTSLGKADTALQEHQSLAAYRTAAEQDAIHDSTKQDTLTTAQLAAANSGITSADKTKLDGIATGATNTSVSATGTATDEVQYITINGVEKKLAGGGGGADVPLSVVNGKICITYEEV